MRFFFEDRSILRCLAAFRSDLHMRLYLRLSPSRMTYTAAPYPWERTAKLRGFKDLHVMGPRLIQAGAIGMCAMYLQVFIVSDMTLYGEYSSYVKARRNYLEMQFFLWHAGGGISKRASYLSYARLRKAYRQCLSEIRKNVTLIAGSSVSRMSSISARSHACCSNE